METTTDTQKSRTSNRDVASVAKAVLLAVGGVMMLADIALIFLWVPTEQVMGVAQRIFYFHVPLAWTGLGNYAGKGLPLKIPQKRSGQCESPSLGTTPDLN